VINVADRFISLREVARQLGLPPSTVVYYKDRFAEHLPFQGSSGRRRRYPYDVIDIFKNIRELFDNNWSAEQIAQHLASGKKLRLGNVSMDQADSPGPGRFAVQATDRRTTELYESQLALQAEVKVLRQDLAELRREHQGQQERYQAVAAAMAQELEEIKRTRAEMERLLDAARHNGRSAPQFPDELLLSHPLVIRTLQDEYIGVLDKDRKPFALRDFVRLIEARAGTRMVDLNWQLSDACWTLVVRLAEDGQEQHLILVTQKTITPSNNLVTEILRMNVNGSDVPDALLPTMFKKIKDSFDGQGP